MTATATFHRRKWSRELDYALRKDLWPYDSNRIAVRIFGPRPAAERGTSFPLR
jgi:nuclear transport factor 2 (NTF2) superfamily protein